ncbi:MFS transporter, partial [Klebsiella pneumoniae]
LAPIVRVQAETLFASSAAGLLTLAGVAIVGVVIIFSLSLTRAVPQRGSVQH